MVEPGRQKTGTTYAKLASQPVNLSGARPLMKKGSPENFKCADNATVEANTEH